MIGKLVHHSETIRLLTMGTMVFFMSNYNLFWQSGFSSDHFRKELFVYPFSLVLVFCVRTFISIPVVKFLHKKIQWLENKPRHISFPFLVITCNTAVVIAVTTLLFKNYLPTRYFQDYLHNWILAFLAAIPLFFFVVRPTVTLFVNWLRTKVKAPTIE